MIAHINDGNCRTVRTWRHRYHSLVLSVISLSLAGCFSAHPKTSAQAIHEELDVPELWQGNIHAVQHHVSEDQNPWGVQLSEDIVAMLEEALDKNFQLQGTALRVQQALADTSAANAARLPNLNFELDHRQSESRNNSDVVSINRSYSAGLSSRWEIDLWGRLAADLKAERADLDMRRYQLQAAEYSLQSQVLIAWVNVLEQSYLRKLNVANIANQKRRLQMSFVRLDSGLASSVDVRNAKQALLRLQATEKDLRLRRDKAQRQLHVLLGRHPRIEALDDTRFPELRQFEALRDSPSIVLNRPDLLALEADVLAEGYRWRAAEKRKLPRIDLSLSYEGRDESLSQAFDIDRWLGSVTGALVQPVLNRGAIVAAAKRNEAEAAISMANYQQALLKAWEEVENGIQTEVILQGRERLLSLALAQSKAAEHQTEDQYNQGLATSFELLAAQRTRINVETDYIRVLASRLRNRIQLALALGLPAASDAIATP